MSATLAGAGPFCLRGAIYLENNNSNNNKKLKQKQKKKNHRKDLTPEKAASEEPIMDETAVWLAGGNRFAASAQTLACARMLCRGKSATITGQRSGCLPTVAP